MPFPEKFVWGAASSAYQIEGAAREDGRGLSVWDVFCEKPDAIWQRHTGDVACDHYHRYREDVALMKEIGLQAYRFSIAWPRVLPEGVGRVNAPGLDFYQRLVDALLEAGIAPYVTLFHWDFPHELFCRGGWLNRDSADWFEEYSTVVRDALSDRVRNWMTFNEPNGVLWAGYEYGIHAPGLRLAKRDQLRIVHNILRAHSRSVAVLRGAGPEHRIGFVYAGTQVHVPLRDTPRHRAAAQRRMFGDRPRMAFSDAWWLDPVYLGHYPEGPELEAHLPLMPEAWIEEAREIHQPLDFFGINTYRGFLVDVDDTEEPIDVPPPPGAPLVSASADYFWPVTPEALFWGPVFYYERYRLPIMVTENGMAGNDWVALDGRVHDSQRIDFLDRYLDAYRRAGESGVDIRGYFLWSILDNFEWNQGYKERYGIVHVDYQTQRRTLKDSGLWYRDVIAGNGMPVTGGFPGTGRGVG